VDKKYRTLVPIVGLPGQAIEASLALIHDFRRVANVSALTGLLRANAAGEGT
jgi:hypothetical protein